MALSKSPGAPLPSTPVKLELPGRAILIVPCLRENMYKVLSLTYTCTVPCFPREATQVMMYLQQVFLTSRMCIYVQICSNYLRKLAWRPRRVVHMVLSLILLDSAYVSTSASTTKDMACNTMEKLSLYQRFLGEPLELQNPFHQLC